MLLKPRRTAYVHNGHLRQEGSILAADEAQLDAALPEFGFPCLLQRREEGQVISIGGVFAERRLLGVAASRYIRTWRPEAGNVTFSKTIVAPPDLLRRVEKLLLSFGWEGVFELELIEQSGGRFTAIDFNPRPYGSLALAVNAGASLPAIWCDWLLKGRAEESTARPGVYYRWEDGDWRHVWSRLRGGRVGAAIAVLRPRRHTAHPYFRASDPAPGFVRGAQALRNSFRKASPGPLARVRGRPEDGGGGIFRDTLGAA